MTIIRNSGNLHVSAIIAICYARNTVNHISKYMLFSPNQWTPLHLAAREGHMNTVESLISKGANINIDNDGVSMSHYMSDSVGSYENEHYYPSLVTACPE